MPVKVVPLTPGFGEMTTVAVGAVAETVPVAVTAVPLSVPSFGVTVTVTVSP